MKRQCTGAKPWRILDVGFGAGDMLARIARWADARGVAVELAGVDLNPKSAPVADARLLVARTGNDGCGVLQAPARPEIPERVHAPVGEHVVRDVRCRGGRG